MRNLTISIALKTMSDWSTATTEAAPAVAMNMLKMDDPHPTSNTCQGHLMTYF